ncbi:MAG TPA: biotin/lipoyl-containing protein, partial [Chloroflexota bacterium]
MPVEVRVPTLGESVVEATVGAWLKREGDQVEAGEPLVQLETEKVNVDVAADQAGVLGTIAAQEGQTVHPGDVLGTIQESAASPSASGAGGPAVSPPAAVPATSANDVAAAAGSVQPAAAASEDQVGEAERPHASPVARRMAEEHGVDLARVEGTGTGGRVTREDVERHLQPAAATTAAQPPQPAPLPAAPSADGARGETRIRMSRRRQTIAQRLLEAQRTAAMLTTFNEVDMTAIMDIRARRREQFQKRYGVGLGFMSFFTKAVVAA